MMYNMKKFKMDSRLALDDNDLEETENNPMSVVPSAERGVADSTIASRKIKSFWEAQHEPDDVAGKPGE